MDNIKLNILLEDEAPAEDKPLKKLKGTRKNEIKDIISSIFKSIKLDSTLKNKYYELANQIDLEDNVTKSTYQKKLFNELKKDFALQFKKAGLSDAIFDMWKDNEILDWINKEFNRAFKNITDTIG